MSLNREVFKDILRKKGLKVTNQRLFVLEALANHQEQHLTTEQIYELVKKDHPEIGLATVYRTIQLLSKLRFIDTVNLNDKTMRYEIGHQYVDGTRHRHHHLVCLECGKLISFQDDLLENLEHRISEKENFQVVDHEVKFYGYCRECQKKK